MDIDKAKLVKVFEGVVTEREKFFDDEETTVEVGGDVVISTNDRYPSHFLYEFAGKNVRVLVYAEDK